MSQQQVIRCEGPGCSEQAVTDIPFGGRMIPVCRSCAAGEPEDGTRAVDLAVAASEVQSITYYLADAGDLLDSREVQMAVGYLQRAQEKLSELVDMLAESV